MDPSSPNEPSGAPPGEPHPTPGAVCWPAVARGAGVGLAVLVVVATVRAILDRSVEDFDASGWTLPLFVALLAGYFLAGWVAQRAAEERGVPDAPYTHGALAGLGAFAAWVPLRVAIWLVRDEQRGLVRGPDGALRPGQVFGALVIAAGIGLLGATLAARRTRAPGSGVEQ
ncbi:MAG: hypothetical protein ACKOA9_06855 [Actinomycetota bacterium]